MSRIGVGYTKNINEVVSKVIFVIKFNQEYSVFWMKINTSLPLRSILSPLFSFFTFDTTSLGKVNLDFV